MLEKFKLLFTNKELLSGNYGIEREMLRIDKDGNLSFNPHPRIFGDKNKNPYITTDFSESQIEVITPTFKDLKELYQFTNALYDIVATEIGDEYLWPQSMPCAISKNKKIPIADFGTEDKDATIYREKLLEKYGGKKQLISGIHFNFSFTEDFLRKIYNISNTNVSYKEFKNTVYLKISRSYIKYNWLLIYILGGTAAVHKSYVCDCFKNLKQLSKDSFSNDGALSYRNGECGYKNKIDLFPSYDSVDDYIGSIQSFIDDKIIDTYKELYSPVRLKAKDNTNLFESLMNDGINYIEYRSIDINPLEKGGIALNDLYFLQIFILFSLLDEDNYCEGWQKEALENQNIIAKSGQNNVMLKNNGKNISKEQWAIEILSQIKKINSELNLGKEKIIDSVIERIRDHKLTYAYKMEVKVRSQGYVNANLNLSRRYKDLAYKNRFSLCGYEDLELSTQILMKEAIKRGIMVKVIDRNDNFISLENKGIKQYVKQATKTSVDNYISVLMMENKVVTKKLLYDNNVNVPKGVEINSISDIDYVIKEFESKPIVIKPKSTNFGSGISIFKEGATRNDLNTALNIAFNHDNTVLIEEFIKGKEYRFLVIGDEVVAILHRVPANITGDGNHSIKELVDEKNKDSLRGTKYRTPLEKIVLDDNAKLFLAQQNKDFDYIPRDKEVVYLRDNSNISTGGDGIDYTEKINTKFKDIAVKAAKAVGAKICGVDMIIEDYNNEKSNYSIIELNFNPAIHIHCYPYKGKERNIAIHILHLLNLI